MGWKGHYFTCFDDGKLGIETEAKELQGKGSIKYGTRMRRNYGPGGENGKLKFKRGKVAKSLCYKPVAYVRIPYSRSEKDWSIIFNGP